MNGGGVLLMLLLCALLRFPTLCMWFMGFTGSSRRGADSWIVVPRLMDRDDDGTDWLSRALRIGSVSRRTCASRMDSTYYLRPRVLLVYTYLGRGCCYDRALVV